MTSIGVKDKTKEKMIIPKEKLNIGVIGAGYIGTLHIKNILSQKNLSLSGIYDCDISKNIYTNSAKSVEDLCKKSHAIIVAVPYREHYKVAKEALHAGCDVLIEKPFTHKIDHARTLIDYAQKNNQVLHAGYSERFNPAVTKLLRIAHCPESVYIQRIGPQRQENEHIVLDLMIHDIDFIHTMNEIWASKGSVGKHSINIISQEKGKDMGMNIHFDNNKWKTTLCSARSIQKRIRHLIMYDREGSQFDLDFKKRILLQRKSQKAEPICYDFRETDAPLQNELKFFTNHSLKKNLEENASEKEILVLGTAFSIINKSYTKSPEEASCSEL